ncbi:MAG TPA: glycosyltransferase family 39 protein [Anaerolineales bacterium]|nr:glycosyltransferase family 39 protein [Anaerolineales bacterium]
MNKSISLILKVVGLLLSLTFAAFGVLSLRQSNLIPGLVMVGLAIILFIGTTILNDRFPAEEMSGAAAKEQVRNFYRKYKAHIGPVIFWAVSVIIPIIVLYAMVDQQRSGTTNRWITAGWVSTILCMIVAMLWTIHWRFPKWAAIRGWFAQYKYEILIVAVFLLIGATLRSLFITQHPYPWSGDEMSVGTEGRRIINGEVTDFFATGWSGQPNWSFVPTAISEILFGQNILAIRLVSIIEGTLAILFLYLLARELFGKTIAALAAGVLVALPIHLQFSRIGVNNIIDSMTVCLVLWLTLRAIRLDRYQNYLWAGITAGLTFYTYVGTRLVLILAIVLLAYTIIRERGYFRKHLLHLGIFIGAAIIVIAPQGYFFYRHPDVFMTRFGQESILLNHWLPLQAQRTGQSMVAIMWKQTTDTVLVYVSQPAVGNFFNSPNPYLTVLGSIFFLFGMGYALVKCWHTRMMILLVWFWSVVIVGGILTLSPPANTRLVMTLPAVAIFIALGTYQFFEYVLRLKIITPTWQTVLSGAVVLILVLQNTFFYFGVYRTKDYFEDASGEFGQEVGLEIRSLGPNYDYYLFGSPRVFAAFPTSVFLDPNIQMVDLQTKDIDTLTLRPGMGNIFASIPENRSDLDRIAQKFPGGTMIQVPRRYINEILFYAYILKP